MNIRDELHDLKTTFSKENIEELKKLSIQLEKLNAKIEITLSEIKKIKT